MPAGRFYLNYNIKNNLIYIESTKNSNKKCENYFNYNGYKSWLHITAIKKKKRKGIWKNWVSSIHARFSLNPIVIILAGKNPQ